jgi:CDP-glycerol glycerophosphotransferase (TagB/SpsB family)
VDFITCWSELQKEELVNGADWYPEQVNVGGIPSYDGYFRKSWLIPRKEYFALHHLDPKLKLLSYACSFVTFSPNYPNVEALVKMVQSGRLEEPCQLLIRLHPNHFIPNSLYEEEANKIRSLIKEYANVHLVEPVPLGGELGYYSGEDMPEKSSMMAYSDVFLTVYSTMVVETAIHQKPIISVCIDSPSGWNVPGKFSLPLTKIGEWPTHLRFRQSGAGKIATDENSLYNAINAYLRNPSEDEVQRKKFILDEVTYTDGSSGKQTAEYLLSLIQGLPVPGKSA